MIPFALGQRATTKQTAPLATLSTGEDPAGGTWSVTGSLNTARNFAHGHLAAQRHGPCCRRNRYRLKCSRQRRTARSCERDLDFHRQPKHSTYWSQGHLAAQRYGPCCRGRRYWLTCSRQRGTVRSRERDLDCHGQPKHRTLWFTRPPCSPTAWSLSQVDLIAI